MKHSLVDFINYINDNENDLMERILSYAKKQNYTKYTSTLVEPWRLSISGLSESLINLIQTCGDDIELTPDEDHKGEAAEKFGIIEAEKHRERGTSLEMFLGLMKYYNQSYRDLIRESKFKDETKEYYINLINRFFDRVEIAFCKTWTLQEHDYLVSELQDKNRQMTNEKNKFLTIFESLSVAVIIVDQNGIIENMNLVAANMFNEKSVSGSNYYSENAVELAFSERFPQLADNYNSFIISDKKKTTYEFFLEMTKQYFSMSFSNSLDISGKFSGTIVIINEITKHIELEQELSKLAETDSLTGANNRRSFLRSFEKELSRKKRYLSKLALIMIDIDHFKKINDTYGHDVGDYVLQYLVSEVQSGIRNTDIFSRWGGEEFLLLLPESDSKQASEFIDRFRIKIANTNVVTPCGHSIKFTISIGLTIIEEDEMDIDALINRVDTALYMAKNQGRNKLVIA